MFKHSCSLLSTIIRLFAFLSLAIVLTGLRITASITPLLSLHFYGVISWQSVLLVEETGGLGENHRSVASHCQTLSHNVVHLALIKI